MQGGHPHRHRVETTASAEIRAVQPSPVDVAITPRQFADKLLLDVRNNGPDAPFAAEVIFIFRANSDGTPDTTAGWAVPWAGNGRQGPSTEPVEIPSGQQRTLDFAHYDMAAINAARSGHATGPHWLFSSLPEPVGVIYSPPIQSGRDLSGRRFVVTLRIYRSSPHGWADHTLVIGISGSAVVCEPPDLKVDVLESDWKDWNLQGFIVAARVQAENHCGKTVRLSPHHWMQTAAPGVVPPAPADLRSIRSAVAAEQVQRLPPRTTAW
jgi:hypothetical protein